MERIRNKKIEELLEKFKNKENSNEDSYYEYIEELDDLELSFEEELIKIFKEIGITQYNICNIGGFHSCGYDLKCLSVSYIDLDGKLKVIPVNYESF